MEIHEKAGQTEIVLAKSGLVTIVYNPQWKTPFVAALKTMEDWLPHRIKLQVAAGFPRFIQIVAEVSS